eukprot:s106_g40.t1
MADGSRETKAPESESSPDFEGDDQSSDEPAVAMSAGAATGPNSQGDKGPPDADMALAGDKDPPGDQPNRESPGQSSETPWVPDRVKRALEKSSTFDEFRKNRPFRFLHLFCGEKDQFGESIRKEAKAARLEVYVEGLDRKKDKEINLASPLVYQEIGKTVEAGEWDACHSGFPCGSFSKIRWRSSPGGPLPVRSAESIYGLPGNTPSMQREADEGTLMASRSAWLHEEQIKSCKRRSVPEISTLENPPGGTDTGSAWDLPEVKNVLADTKSSSVEFNTCAYQSKLKKRWYKPARWAGKLESMGTLARVCKCPPWVEHVPLIGKQNTEPAGAYPEELTDAVAKKVISAWKRILNLEWLRYQLAQKADQVNELQKKWLANEEKKRKREYEDAEPVDTRPLSQEPKSMGAGSKALEAKDKETEVLPSSSAGPSKKQRREEQNDYAIGGMRNPAVAVARLHQVRRTGEMIHEAWLEFLRKYPNALKAAKEYGSKDAELDELVLHKWRQRLETLLGVEEKDGITLKEALEFKSPLNADLWDAWRVCSRDPEQCIGQWAREGAPLGMDREIEYSGIFPKTEPEEALETRMDMSALEGMRNYESVETQKDEALIEVERYVNKGFCKVLPWEDLHKRFPEGTASKLALIIKQKPDGSTKRRIVIDMKRSQGNKRAKVEERIILPRAQDIVNSLRVMRAREHELREEGEPRSLLKGSQMYEEAETEFIMLDLQDAFCHFGVHPEELKHCVSPGLESGTGILWVAMLFGFRGAPLVMGRLSAAVGRLVQSLLHPAEGQVQMYIDDLALMLRGSTLWRNVQLSKVIYVLAAFGVQLAMAKGERGKRVTWIGTTFELFPHKVVLGTPRKLVEEILETVTTWRKKGMVPTKDLRAFLGKLSWVSGIVPRLRWTVTALYGVLTKVLQEEATEEERAKKRPKDQRPKVGLVAVKRMGTTLPWLAAAFETPENMMVRNEPLEDVEPVWGVVTDASPKGVGGVLIHRVGPQWHMVEAFEAPVQRHQAEALEIPYGEAAGHLGRACSAAGIADMVHQDPGGPGGHSKRQFSGACYGQEAGIRDKVPQLPRS